MAKVNVQSNGKEIDIWAENGERMDLDQIKHEYITSKENGKVSFDWSFERCGATSWSTIKGYIDGTPIKITVNF